jgi:predicted HicB family RNase H-like nuclease
LVFKGYACHFTYDEDLDLFEGVVSNSNEHLITFQGKSVDAVTTAFKDAVNEYIEWRKKMGKEPYEPFLEP